MELSIKNKQTKVISGNAIENRIRYLAATRSVMYGLRMSGPGIGRLTAARTGAKLTSVHDRPGITPGGACVSHSHDGDTHRQQRDVVNARSSTGTAPVRRRLLYRVRADKSTQLVRVRIGVLCHLKKD